MCFPSTECFVEQQRVSIHQNDPPLVVTDGPGVDAGVASRHTSLTGPSHRMITLPPEVFAQQPARSQLEYEGVLPTSQIQVAVQSPKSVCDRDGPEGATSPASSRPRLA